MTEALDFKAMQFYGPVTALEFIGSTLLLAGRGSNLSIYNWKLAQVVKEVQVFKRNKIQGIVVGPSHIMVWGAYSLAFVSRNELLGDFKLREYTLPDWIMVGAWGYDSSAWIVTAHNVLLNISSDYKRVERIYTCGIDCILYSASILFSAGSVYVAAGTVFGNIEIWSSKNGAIVSSLKGHEGSIFNVQFSLSGSRLVSCSDDRSVRIWDLHTNECIAVGWGHSARIWQAKYLDDDTIITVGEDSTTRVWRLRDGSLSCAQIWEGHCGRSIWSLAIRDDRNIVATGGADGRVLIWNLSAKPSLIDGRMTMNFEDIASSMAIKVGSIKQCTATRTTAYAFSTTTGYVALLETVDNSWKEVYYSSALAGYSLLKGWDDKLYVCIGDRQGSVHIIGTGDSSQCIIVDPPSESSNKVIDMVPLSKGDMMYILVQYGNTETPWSFIALQNHNGISLKYSLALSAQPTFPIASACLHPDKEILIVGSRFGALAVYRVETSPVPVAASGCWRRIISDDCITSVIPENTYDNGMDILATSRNGSYCICNVSLLHETGSASLEKLHLNRMAKGSIEGAAKVDHGLVFWGFRNNYFFVWNETLQYEIMSEICGGPHRSWHFMISPTTKCSFVYTKASSISIVKDDTKSELSAAAVTQEGSHGREIRAISVAPFSNDRNALLVATGAEDTCIRLSNVSADGRMRNLCVLRRHVSGLQQLQWSPNGMYLFSSAAREEFIVWKVTVRGQNVYLYPISSAPIATNLPDLRVMDFAVNETMCNGALCYFIVTVYSDSAVRIWLFQSSDASFRLLSMGRYKNCCIFKAAFYHTENSFHLLIGSSDGNLVSWDLSEIRRVALYCPPSELPTNLDFPEPEWTLASHQSSIRSLMIVRKTDSSANESSFIVSGGDDNCIAISKAGSTFRPSIEYTVSGAHASTITSLTQLTDDVFLSVAVDQRIRAWKLLPDNDNKLSLLEEAYTTVSDTGCLSTGTIRDTACAIMLIGGAGLGVWHVDKK
ncbi:WD40-repeat-containing domain protein [Lipomyces kononenkoae]